MTATSNKRAAAPPAGAVTLVALKVIPYTLPLADALVTANGRMTHRHGFLVCLDDRAGRRGWGDAAPWPGFGSDHQTVMLQLGALAADMGALAGARIDTTSAVTRLLSSLELAVEVRFALELAALDLLGQWRDVSLAWLLHGENHRPTVSSQQLYRRGHTGGAAWQKVKVAAAPLAHDIARVKEIRALVPAGAQIKVDANGGWSLPQAVAAVPALAQLGVTAIEQPLPTSAAMAAWRTLKTIATKHGVKLLADESITDANALRRFASANALDGVVLKPMFLGGVLPALSLARQAQALNLNVCITNALESAVGRAGALHLASGFDGVHGLGSRLARDFATLAPSRGVVLLPAGAGLGMSIDAIALRGAVPQPVVSSHDDYALPHPVRSAASAHPNRTALVAGATTINYEALSAQVALRASALRLRGVRAGMTVAIDGPYNAAWVTLFHALGWLGAAVAPVPPKLPLDQRSAWLRAVGAEAEIDSDSEWQADEPATERFWPLDEPRLVLCTSGTTALPKVVSLTSGQLVFSAFGSALRLEHHQQDRWLCCLPLHHIGGLSILIRCAFYATTAVLHPRFDAAQVASALDSGTITLVSLVPSMLRRVLDARAHQPFPSQLRALLLGGAPAPPALLRRCRQLSAPVVQTWGMTEAASQVATQTLAQRGEWGHVGRPLPFARVEQAAGRLAIRGPVVRGMYVSSDVGQMGARGLQLHGRADAVFISGGENIAPQRIEAILLQHDDVIDALVVGIPSARWGRRPLALVQTGTSAPVRKRLLQHCRAALPDYLVPDDIMCVESIPRNQLGKPLRAQALQLALAQQTNHPPQSRPLSGTQPADAAGRASHKSHIDDTR